MQQQKFNNDLHNKYLSIQIERAEIGKDCDIMKKKILEVDLAKAEELAQIEINKQRAIAELEIEARRRDLNL